MGIGNCKKLKPDEHRQLQKTEALWAQAIAKKLKPDGHRQFKKTEA